MAIETDEDRLAFFSSDDFGDVATITLSDSTVIAAVPGIYDSAHLTRGLKQNNQFTYQAGQDMSGSKPQFMCRSSDVPGVKNGQAAIAIADAAGQPIGNFTAFDVQHDGTGMCTIRMMRS